MMITVIIIYDWIFDVYQCFRNRLYPGKDFAYLPLDIIADIPFTWDSTKNIRHLRGNWNFQRIEHCLQTQRYEVNEKCVVIDDFYANESLLIDSFQLDTWFMWNGPLLFKIGEVFLHIPEEMTELLWEFFEILIVNSSATNFRISNFQLLNVQEQIRIHRILSLKRVEFRLELETIGFVYEEEPFFNLMASGKLRSLRLFGMFLDEFFEDFLDAFLSFIKQKQFVEFVFGTDIQCISFKFFIDVLDYWLSLTEFPGHMQKVEFALTREDQKYAVDVIEEYGGRRLNFKNIWAQVRGQEEHYEIRHPNNAVKLIEISVYFPLINKGHDFCIIHMLLTSGNASVASEFEEYCFMRNKSLHEEHL
ncbi:hypothetical protein L596_020544 [Steinernema carpocapsae]|uniref:Uncharacterized protein n=1 Tax=Steinernema carpocapsae TaxID=34508 RepID=A0A4U5MTV1_STECR|nr:hypothetical protein L596_020544 [Steinernema carpocapsae]